MGQLRKVLFVAHSGALSSGGEISNYQLMKYLKKNGYEVKVVLPDWGDETYQQSLKRSGIEFYTQPYSWWHGSESTVFELQNTQVVSEICKCIRNFKATAVVTNTTVVPWGAMAAALMNKPHVWITREFPIGQFAFLDEKMEFIRKYSNAVMANSKQLAAFLAAKYKIQAEQFYSYVDVGSLEIDPTLAKTRLVSPNHIDERKNQVELIEALGILRNRHKEFKIPVVLIGGKDEKYWSKVRALIKEQGLHALVEVHPFTDKPWSLVGKNDILVQTSLSESIGRTTIEAMKLGIPVIASGIPGHIEAFELGGGTLYESGNSKSLADKIEDALANRDRLKKDAQLTKERVLKNLSEDACSAPFLKVLDRVIKESNPQKELSHIAPYFNEYVDNREHITRTQEQTIANQKRHIAQQGKDILKQQRDIAEISDALEALRNSKTYKLGNYEAQLIKKVVGPLRFVRRNK